MSTRPTNNRRTTNVRQRKQQQHLLDVKIRASTERRRRVARISGIVFRVVVLGSLALGLWFGGKEALRRFVWENPDYAVREIKFATDGTLTRDQVLKAGDMSEGRNIFLVDLDRSRSAIEKMPQVESVEVNRTLPNRLSVNVTERRPIAWVVSKADEDPTVSDKSFLIDARGILMKPKSWLEDYLHLPVISGVQTENIVAGDRMTTSEMQAALELIRLTSDSTRFQARNVDLAKGYCLVVTGHNHAKITFGLDHIDAQLARLNRYFARAAEDQKEIQTVNLIVERNTPVTFVEPVPAEPDPAAPVGAIKPPDPKAKTAAPGDKPKTAPAPGPVPPVPVPRATAVATPIPAGPTPAQHSGFFSKTKSNATPTPAPAKADGVRKQPFHLR